jgi:hypothetical protein
MKSDDFIRSARANRPDREKGDAPSIGRVSRMPGTGLPKTLRSRRKKRSGEHTRENFSSRSQKWVVLIWTWIFALVAVSLVALAGWMWVSFRE